MDEKTRRLVSTCLGISESELNILLVINDYGERGASYSDIAERLGVTRAYVSIVVSKLKMKGLVRVAGKAPRREGMRGKRPVLFVVDGEELRKRLEECATRLAEAAKTLADTRQVNEADSGGDGTDAEGGGGGDGAAQGSS